MHEAASSLPSDVPVVVQRTGWGSRQAANTTMTTIAHPVGRHGGSG
jgi:hypothetical protein